MLKLLKIKKQRQQVDEILEAVDEVSDELHGFGDETLPQIKLFISVDQLAALNEHDEEREAHARLFLREKEKPLHDAKVYETFVQKFEKAYVKLGNENSQCPHCRRTYTTVPAEVKKCLGCAKGFFKAKRPQDGQMVLVREENRELLNLQWENIKRAELIERINHDELEKIRLQAQSHEGKQFTLFDAHFFLVRQYTAKALLSGRFRLYSSLIYYMAEHDRYQKEFAKALMYYFYVFYLQVNGASNSVVFADRVSVHERIVTRIENLLRMIDSSILECEDFFAYSIGKVTAFEYEHMPYSVAEVYEKMVQMCREAEKTEADESQEASSPSKGSRFFKIGRS